MSADHPPPAPSPQSDPRTVQKPAVCDGCGEPYRLVPLGGICHQCGSTRWRIAEETL
jgi:Zn finger protein HypA/HybF involved in hydrogenase expression